MMNKKFYKNIVLFLVLFFASERHLCGGEAFIRNLFRHSTADLERIVGCKFGQDYGAFDKTFDWQISLKKDLLSRVKAPLKLDDSLVVDCTTVSWDESPKGKSLYEAFAAVQEESDHYRLTPADILQLRNNTKSKYGTLALECEFIYMKKTLSLLKEKGNVFSNIVDLGDNRLATIGRKKLYSRVPSYRGHIEVPVIRILDTDSQQLLQEIPLKAPDWARTMILRGLGHGQLAAVFSGDNLVSARPKYQVIKTNHVTTYVLEKGKQDLVQVFRPCAQAEMKSRIIQRHRERNSGLVYSLAGASLLAAATMNLRAGKDKDSLFLLSGAAGSLSLLVGMLKLLPE